MLKTHLIFPAFLIALATPQIIAAQTPSKAAVTENASNLPTKTLDPANAPQPAVQPAVQPAIQPPQVMSFLEWKAQRVHEAQQKLEQLGKGNPAPQVFQEGKSVTDPTSKPNEQKLNFNVDVALQLNIQDYFSLYLKSLTQEEFKEATKKLSPDEVSELLTAYKNSMEKEKKLPLKFSKNPKDNAKSQN
jgi:hypothetical protein